MKKLITVLLCVLLTVCCCMPVFAVDGEPAEGTAEAACASFGAYERVFIIGIDGAGRFYQDANTPNFDRIFANGAVDHVVRTETISMSAENWAAMLTGVCALKHGRNNLNTGIKERSGDVKYPSIFAYARRAFPDAELASFVNWNNINHGIIETDVGVNKVNVTDDALLTDAICDYFNEGNAPKLFFCQFDSVDHVGHSHKGSKSPEFLGQIEIVDGYLGRVYDTLEANGLLEDSLFMVVSDHGHTIMGGHGGFTMRETNTTIAAAGKTVVAGGKLDEDARTRDVAAIVLYALGIERPENMSSRLPADLFVDVEGEVRKERGDFLDFLDWLFAKFAWIFTSLTAKI